MTTIQVCRTCLAHDTRMYTIANTPLQLFYEKITNLPFKTQDGRPSILCYICYHLLKKSHRFTQNAVKAYEVLQEIYKSGNKVTRKLLASVEQKHLTVFNETPVILDPSLEASEDMVTMDNIEIKIEREEMDTDETEFPEVDVLEYATNEIKKEEIEVEDTQIDLPQSSDFKDDFLQSITVKVENEDIEQETKGVLEANTHTSPGRPEVQSSSNENTAVENTLKKVTIEPKGITDLKAKLKDHGTKQPLVKKKIVNDFLNMSNNKILLLPKDVILHTGGKLFICNYCGKKLSTKSNLIGHVRIHTGEEKTFTCNYCEKKFLRKSDLTRHVNLHSGEKPFSCNYCQKKFTMKSSLTRHIQVIHLCETVNKFSCDCCPRKFALKSDLAEHVRIHMGEKPFTCNLCDKKFIRKCDLTRHINVIHMVEKEKRIH